MGILSKFSLQSKKQTMTTDAVLNGTYVPTTPTFAENFIYLLPDNFKKEFNINIGRTNNTLIVIGNYQRTIMFEPTDKTQINFEYNKNEDDPLITTVTIYHPGKMTIVMNIVPYPDFSMIMYL